MKNLWRKLRGWVLAYKHKRAIKVPRELREIINKDHNFIALKNRPKGCSNNKYRRRLGKHNRLLYLFVKQKGKCALTGLPLYRVCGDGINIDHKVPKSRGGTNARENLQLVYKIANYIKKERLESELVSEDYREMRSLIVREYPQISSGINKDRVKHESRK